MKACIYCRTSSDETTNPRDSIKTQENSCREESKKQGAEVVRIYSDIGKSGGSIEGRKEFIQMLEDAKTGRFQRIYILDLSRFSRRIIDQETTLEELKKLNVNVYSVVDGNLENGEEVVRQIKGVLNQAQRKTIQQRTEIEHQMRLKQNRPLCRPPFGYKIDKKTKLWIIDEKKVEIVKQAFDMKDQGKELEEISKAVKIMIPTLKYMLKNKSYLGYVKYRDELIPSHPAIINKKVFENVNK